MLQPDLGTALMVTFGGMVVMFLAGLPLRLFVGGGALVAAAIPIIYNFVLHDYQRNRVAIFLDPEADPLGAGYHISQSKIAIGSGGVFGKGFLNGTQSHLDYLPEGHTDFVFATMAEEWGLFGGIGIIIGFALVIRWGLGVAIDATSRFARLTAAGLTSTIFFYVAHQPDDGDGPRPGRRHPAAALFLRRIGDDDGDDLPRLPDGDRPRQPPQFAPALRPVASLESPC